jgi:hypothetical protein
MSNANETARPDGAAPAELTVGTNGIEMNSFDAMWRFAKCVSISGFAPKGMERPESILVALQLSTEVGLSPMAGLQNIAVVNGRPSIYGDAALALVRASGLLESYKEEEVGKPFEDSFGVKVTAKRKGYDPMSETFTVAEAKHADLWGKSGPWKQYPKRMLKFRARSYVLRDSFGDVLKGMRTVEETMDIPEMVNVTPMPSVPRAADAFFGGPNPADGMKPDTVSEEPKVTKAKKAAPIEAEAQVVAKPVAPPETVGETETVDNPVVELGKMALKSGLTQQQVIDWAKSRKMDATKPEDARRMINGWSSIVDMIKPARPEGVLF